MPDLMKTPSNRRYVVNFQHKEPINKYDIWLSFNKHEQGNQVIVDSEYLADKDLVFKIYMNGEWRPILGIPVSYEGIIQALEELDKKKMNIVPNFVGGHIPIFQQGSDECDQLIDGGTIEELVSNALTTIINGGGAIPIQRATTTTLGGVKAGLHIHNNNPDQYVEAKFKFPEGYNEGGIVENDRLYISASEIIQAINTYIGGGGSGLDLQLMGPSTRGGAMANLVPVSWDANTYIPILINQTNEHMYVNGEDILSVLIYILENNPLASIYEAGEGIDITENVISNTLADDTHLGGIRAMQNPNPHSERVGIEVMFGNGAVVDACYGRSVDEKHLCIGGEQIWALLNWQDEYTGPMFRDGFGIYAQAHHEYNSHTGVYDDFWTFNIKHSNPSDWGRILKLKEDGSEIEWIPIPSGGQTYDPLGLSSTPGQDYVITAPQPNSGYLKWDGTFDNPPAGDSFAFTWKLSTGTKIADYVLNNVAGSLYAPNSVYTAGDGIDITNNVISIDTSHATTDYVLGYNGTNVEWVPQRVNTYSAGYGINIDSQLNVISGDITDNSSNVYVATSDVLLRALSAGGTARRAVILRLDGSQNATSLYPYNYYEVEFALDGPGTLTIEIDDQLELMDGNPVYVLLTLTGKTNGITVSVSETSRPRTININNAIVNGELNLNYTHFLITMQFGIARIEPLENVAVNNNNENEEE